MVPVNTAPEWSSFYTNFPAGVSVGACVPSDPCDGKSIGQACAGTTALYAGVFDGGKYMIMPSGCADSTSNPTCAGTDTVKKIWNDGTTNFYDIPAIANVAAAATPSSSSERGHYTTPIIAAITAPAEGGLHAAARYCDQMDYGGFTDWYLPSKSELTYIYCKSSPASHNTSYPQESVNCGGSGPSGELTGFGASNYWSSTERTYDSAWILVFNIGVQGNLGKDNNNFIRCVRRY